MVWQWDNSEPFGNNAPNENPSGLGTFTYNVRFPGQYFDPETGTNYNWARDYDPSTGRYIESDPIGLMGGIDTYAYVDGNPLSYFDLDGLMGNSRGGATTGGKVNEGRMRNPDNCPNKGELCKLLKQFEYDIDRVWRESNRQRRAGTWDDPILRPIENYAYAASTPSVTTADVMANQGMIKPFMWVFGRSSPPTSCALAAGLLGVNAQKRTKDDWKKYCDCK